MIIDARAISDEHFELLGGTHSDTFIRFSRIADDDARLQLLADWFLPAVAAWLPTVIVAPSTAGVALGATIARRLAVPFHLAEVVERLIHAPVVALAHIELPAWSVDACPLCQRVEPLTQRWKLTNATAAVVFSLAR